MTRPLVVIRPEPGLTATVGEAGRLGLAPVAAPLFAIEPRPWDAPDPATIDALLIGSANALRHAGSGLAGFRGKPVYAVGDATAAAARDAGFAVAGTGEGGLQVVLDALAGERLTLLRLAGEEHVPLVAPDGIVLVVRTAYASVPRPLPDALLATLRSGAVVLLHSAAAARHFASECDRAGIAREGLALAALAPRVAEAAGEGWDTVEIASASTDTALLALARDMCHSAR